MLGVITNTLAVIIGSIIGLLFKKGIPDKIANAVMVGLGLCTIYIGISGSLKGDNAIITIVSMVLGSIIGTIIDIDCKINRLSTMVEKSFRKTGIDTVNLSEGFVMSSMLFCVGAMAIVGSLNAGFSGDNEMLFTKSVLDFISAIMLSVSLGIGVLFSAVFVLVFQGGIALLAGLLQPILTNEAISELTCVGSLLIIGLGLNLLGITKIKVANYLPAIIFAPIVTYFADIILRQFA